MRVFCINQKTRIHSAERVSMHRITEKSPRNTLDIEMIQKFRIFYGGGSDAPYPNPNRLLKKINESHELLACR